MHHRRKVTVHWHFKIQVQIGKTGSILWEWIAVDGTG